MVFAPVEEQIGLIEGLVPDSKEEWWVAKALWRYDIYFMYQFQIYGGTSRRGGLVVDFIVFNPTGTPLLVHGDYWHRDELDGSDKRKMIEIADYFKIPVELLLVLWGHDAGSEEDVMSWVKKNVVR